MSAMCTNCGLAPRRGTGRNTWCTACKSQWQREYKAGLRRFKPVPDPIASPDGCLLWQGTIMPNGYGYQRHDGRMQYAHRVAWQKARGPIPDGLTIDHLCCVKSCINVQHMELVTRAENTRRAGERRRNAGLTGRCRRHGAMDRVTPKGRRYCSACAKENNARRSRRVSSS